MIYTFYSFKGGVGRSMALANVAEMLYRRGLDVLMVDFDLEAPGLERYFNVREAALRPEEVLRRRGLMDMLISYKELRALTGPPQPSAADDAACEDAFDCVVEPLTNFVVPVYPKKPSGGGSLRLIPAGRRDGEEFTRYAQRVREFDWNDFYARWDGAKFFEWFVREAAELAPVVLVDSRTGVTEMGGVCVYQLADVVLMFVATNEQNLGGTDSMARSLLNRKLVSEARKGRPLASVFVPSRVENAEKVLLDRFADRFDATFGGLTPLGKDFKLFKELNVPYVPYFSFMENVAAREPESPSADRLITPFNNIIRAAARVEPEGGPLRQSYLPTEPAPPKRSRVFISYKRGLEPDEALARLLRESLVTDDHHVFTDEMITVGTDWVKRIESELRGADYLIALLSEGSLLNEMTVDEIVKAQRLYRDQGRPAIIPVRVNYDGPFPYSLGSFLDRIQWVDWKGERDTHRLVETITSAVASGGPQPEADPEAREPAPGDKSPRAEAAASDLESPEGVVSPRSPFYVARQADDHALEVVRMLGGTIMIKGPRQTGKTTLLLRMLNEAAASGKRVAYLDFHLFDRETLSRSRRFFRQFCIWLTEQLGVENRVWEYFDEGDKSPIQMCTDYVESYLLQQEELLPVVIAMDEVDRLAPTPFAEDFFSMLRSWHNLRASEEAWGQVSIVMATSADPYTFIRDVSRSPFNIGTVIELADFTPEQTDDLNRRHGLPLTRHELRQFTELVGGHPYLVRRALYLIADRKLLFSDLLEHAAEEDGPFGDHLRSHLFYLQSRPELLEALRVIIKQGKCPDMRAYFELHSAGLVARQRQDVSPRCRLYADFFLRYLDV
jgi:AAA-like domain/TIR domain/CobQ/CobB/MinD/ParA nucleotide binding domain